MPEDVRESLAHAPSRAAEATTAASAGTRISLEETMDDS
jgi:hypothetical protein